MKASTPRVSKKSGKISWEGYANGKHRLMLFVQREYIGSGERPGAPRNLIRNTAIYIHILYIYNKASVSRIIPEM